MIKIALHHLKFHAFHGLYKEEKAAGNDFEVNVEVYIDEHTEMITTLEETINYATLYQIVKDRMNTPEPLLETIVMDIAQRAKFQFPQISEINISISKLQLPLLNFQGEANVTYNKRFN